MHYKTLIKLNKYDFAIEGLSDLRFEATHPLIRQEAQFDLAVAQWNLKAYLDAAEHFINIGGSAWTPSDSLVIRNKAMLNLRLMSLAHFSVEDLLWLIQHSPYVNIQSILATELIRKTLAGDIYDMEPDTTQVKVVLQDTLDLNELDQYTIDEFSDKVAEENPNDPFIISPLQELDTLRIKETNLLRSQDSLLREHIMPLVDDILAHNDLDSLCKLRLQRSLNYIADFNSRNYQGFRIGVLVPINLDVFDGTVSQIVGSQILTGLLLRMEEFNGLNPGKYLSLYIRSTSGQDSSSLIRLIDDLVARDSISMLIGPIYSKYATPIAEHCDSIGLPMITPTATDEYITLGKSNIFQINPTHRMRGRIIARHVLTDSTKQHFAIFSEDSSYSYEMAAGFRDEILAHGRSVDLFGVLPPNFSNLRNVIDSLELPEPDDLMGYPETRYDAIYLPFTNMESIGISLSQLKVYNITGDIIGSGDWHDASILNRYDDLIDSVVYAIDSYISPTDTRALYVKDNYRKFWKMEAPSLMWHGYDVLDYLIYSLNLSEQFPAPDAITTALKQMPPYKAIHTNIYFGGRNINQRMSIMMYKNGMIIPKSVEPF
jgi:ABC-type branched-subunit amino acid transport system substrate-binding protein